MIFLRLRSRWVLSWIRSEHTSFTNSRTTDAKIFLSSCTNGSNWQRETEILAADRRFTIGPSTGVSLRTISGRSELALLYTPTDSSVGLVPVQIVSICIIHLPPSNIWTGITVSCILSGDENCYWSAIPKLACQNPHLEGRSELNLQGAVACWFGIILLKLQAKGGPCGRSRTAQGYRVSPFSPGVRTCWQTMPTPSFSTFKFWSGINR